MTARDPVRLFVFSHPNHELAVFGLVRRWRPHVVFLTDGGGEDRVADTRRGLSSLALLEQARFLGHSEASFYGALLDRDADFFRRVAGQVRQAIDAVRPAEVYCDAVEFYNPVHDICLPIVRAALQGLPGIELFEIPLIHQRAAQGEQYEVQRVPPDTGRRPLEVRLTAEEVPAKCHARDTVYGCLKAQMGKVLATVSTEHLAVEHVVPASPRLSRPGDGRALRYEWRGETLRRRGEIQRVITYAGHYAPVAEVLVEAT
jgi:hypothetical protein